MKDFVKMTACALLVFMSMALVFAQGGARLTPPDIPHGHLPPPGECKIWLPGVPPGQQGPPGACTTLAAQVPVSAWLVQRTSSRGVVVTPYAELVTAPVVTAPVVAPVAPPVVAPPVKAPVPRLETFRNHLPLVGECRMWFPYQEPAHQPPAAPCSWILGDVPLGAWVLYYAEPGRLVVTEYHPDVKGQVVRTEAFAFTP